MKKGLRLLIPILTSLAFSALGQTFSPTAQDNTDTLRRKVINVSSEMLEKSAAKKIWPDAPAGVRASGIVRVRVEINVPGKVVEAQAISGPKALRKITVEAAKRWEWKPLDDVNTDIRYGGVLNFVFPKK
jgi:outer membrane biosynthesis protein TonB